MPQNSPVTSSPRLPRVRASELVGRGWLNTGGRDVTLADLRGKIVILDFWTFCCINCLHVLDELRDLEAKYADELVIIGVHSPKFVHEADPEALAAAVERYEVHHPVLDDPELTTWSAYAAKAWPTLVVIDPEGYIVWQMAGEGHASALDALVAELITEHDAKGTLHRGDGPYVAPAPTSGTLRFPAKVIGLPNGNLLVADAGHHSLAELTSDGETLVRRIGSGERGLLDGAHDVALFSEPNGLCLVPEELRARTGYDVLVADTVNHVLRGVRLADGAVTTVAGTGEQFMVGASDNITGRSGIADLDDAYNARSIRLSSPWDVEWFPAMGAFLVADAGNHTLWAFGRDRLAHVGGTMNEGLLDGRLADAWFAQPSGLAVGTDAALWVADAETSALRRVEAVEGTPEGTVSTAVGQGLFDFGHRDGAADQALLQHPLGLAVLPDGSVVVADTYNGALRRFTPHDDGPGEVTTLATDLAEPSDVVVLVDGEVWAVGASEAAALADDARVELLVVESAAHRLTRISLPAATADEVLDGGAHRTQRPVTEVAASIRIDVPFIPAPGQKLDDRFGPSTRLRVSASPAELLLDGAGDAAELTRTLRLDPRIGEGVLHVTAQAASCDDDPAVEFPACHLAQQDWGVPVRVADGGDDEVSLPLRG